MAARTYSDEEVQQILARAIERADEDRAKLTINDLADIGAELGVSREAIERAAQEVDGAGNLPAASTALVPAPVNDALGKHKAKERKKLLRRILTYVAVVSFCAFINITTGGRLWVQWMAAGWGLALVISIVKHLTRDDDDLAEELAKGLSKRERKELRREARKAQKLSEPERVRVDAAVERVVKQERLRVSPEPDLAELASDTDEAPSKRAQKSR